MADAPAFQPDATAGQAGLPATSADAPATPADVEAAGREHHHHHAATQWILLAVTAGAYLLFWFAGNLASIPPDRQFEASLLAQPTLAGAVADVLVTLVLFLATFFVVTALTRRYWIYAGALAAAAGLAAWSFRGGSSRFIYLAANNFDVSSTVFWILALEMLLLGLIVGAGWLLVLPRFVDPAVAPSLARIPRPDGDAIKAVLTQSAFGLLGVVLLVPNPEKKQAVFGVLTAFLLATALAQHFFQDERAARWYWAGPILVGIVGYVINSFGPEAALAVQTGQLHGTFAALARPVPLDYASAGVAGSLLGYWIGSDHPVQITEPAAANA